MILDIDLITEKVNKMRKDDSLVFLVFSDLHTENVDSEFAQKLMSMLSTITTNIEMDAVIDMGDNVSMLGRTKHITNQELKIVLDQLFSGIMQSVNCPLFMVNGNHDAIGTDFFKPDFWNEIVKNKFVDESAVYHSDGAYYYADYDHCKTRMIFLSVPYESDLRATYPTPLWKFGSEQLKWLAENALDTSYDVLIFSHVPLFYCYCGDETRMLDTWDGEKVTKSYFNDLCGRIEDYKDAVAIMEAFQQHESYENEQLGIKMHGTESKAQLVACFSGHTHEDYMCRPYEKCGEDTNPLPCPQIVIKSFSKKLEYDVAMDIVIWTPSDNMVHMVRCGDGENREISIKGPK